MQPIPGHRKKNTFLADIKATADHAMTMVLVRYIVQQGQLLHDDELTNDFLNRLLYGLFRYLKKLLVFSKHFIHV